MINERKPLVIGTRYGRLVVVMRVADKVNPSKTEAAYECLCDCGGTKVTTAGLLKKGETVSCGCKKIEIGDRTRTHGLRHSTAYESWAHMKQRCNNPTCEDYPNYGARGIVIEDGWEDFSKFYSDMGDCPSGLSLDRIHVHGNYNKDNCKWSDDFEQAVNKRKRKHNTSGRTGVSWHKHRQKWQVSFKLDDVAVYGGIYSNFEDAVLAREALEMKYHGFVRTPDYEARTDLEEKEVTQ